MVLSRVNNRDTTSSQESAPLLAEVLSEKKMTTSGKCGVVWATWQLRTRNECENWTVLRRLAASEALVTASNRSLSSGCRYPTAGARNIDNNTAPKATYTPPNGQHV